jgi:NDP-4-keto-2,6-dideoxyhexose 3-C-methyltransferase
MYKTIDRCRICRSRDLVRVLDLGDQVLTGIFPRDKSTAITKGPLRLVKCPDGPDNCGLVQLEQSYDLNEMYGDNYGYRSGLNVSMVTHLHGKLKNLGQHVELIAGDLVIDIGSNDSTTLQGYPSSGLTLVGVDPTGVKFREYYPPHIHLIPEFFAASLIEKHFPNRKAKVITSFSMFYDLEDPLAFMREVYDVLADDGVWVFEQSYMPAMLDTTSYDTVCHEHLEFYRLKQIDWMARRVGFTIVEVEFNDINGGSFSITVAKSRPGLESSVQVEAVLESEREQGLDTLAPYQEFARRAAASKHELVEFVRNARMEEKTVVALGASTKGNVLLQYCGFTQHDISAVGEVNADKFGCYTPGSWIPIVPERELLATKPDYAIVLPWHFRSFFEQHPAMSGMTLVFPLPQLVVSPVGIP